MGSLEALPSRASPAPCLARTLPRTRRHLAAQSGTAPSSPTSPASSTTTSGLSGAQSISTPHPSIPPDIRHTAARSVAKTRSHTCLHHAWRRRSAVVCAWRWHRPSCHRDRHPEISRQRCDRATRKGHRRERSRTRPPFRDVAQCLPSCVGCRRILDQSVPQPHNSMNGRTSARPFPARYADHATGHDSRPACRLCEMETRAKSWPDDSR